MKSNWFTASLLLCLMFSFVANRQLHKKLEDANQAIDSYRYALHDDQIGLARLGKSELHPSAVQVTIWPEKGHTAEGKWFIWVSSTSPEVFYERVPEGAILQVRSTVVVPIPPRPEKGHPAGRSPDVIIDDDPFGKNGYVIGSTPAAHTLNYYRPSFTEEGRGK